MKLPRTQHIEGSRMPPGRSDPEAVSFSALVGKFLVIEEKVDGSGVSLEFDDSLNLIVNHRANPATGPEFKKLHQWAAQRHEALFDVLENRYVMFGEWMFKKHTIFYNMLPDYFLESDIYDKKEDRWLSTARREDLLEPLQICSVPLLKQKRFNTLHDTIRELLHCLQDSFLISPSGPSEGLYIKDEENDRVNARYKYVRYEFLRQILDSGSHVRDREIIPNQLTKLY